MYNIKLDEYIPEPQPAKSDRIVAAHYYAAWKKGAAGIHEGFNDLADADKSKLKILAASMRNTANYALSIITEAEPEVTGADFNVCEEDGDLITTISVNK